MKQKRLSKADGNEFGPPATGWKSLQLGDVWLVLALFAFTFLFYLRALQLPFIPYDDPLYVTENTQVRKGLDFQTLRWAFFNAEGGIWHPLTMCSHLLDVRLFGLDPKGHHLINVLLHALNASLLFLFSMQLTGRRLVSLLVSIPFAIHPLNVESVAWVSERKNLLSTLFWLLALICYVVYSRKSLIKNYALMMLFLVLGLLCKPMLVTFPFMLLLLDYWPLNRAGWNQVGFLRIPGRNLLLEKVPMLVVSILFSWIAIRTQQGAEALSGMDRLSLLQRIANAINSYGLYLCKMFYPVNLSVFYPHPGTGIPMERVFVSAMAIIFITVGSLKFARLMPFLITGWFWFLGVLVPVIGLVQVGGQAMADRYAYVPMIGIFLIIALLMQRIMDRGRKSRQTGIGAIMIVVIALAIQTQRQISHWESPKDLFSHALKTTRNNYIAYNQLGMALAKEGNNEAALQQYRQALESRPDYAIGHYNLGRLFVQMGREEEALEAFRRAIDNNPRSAESFTNIGLIHARRGRLQEAIDFYKSSLQLKPDHALTWNNLGSAYGSLGDYQAALEAFFKAVELEPGMADAHLNIGMLQLQMNRLSEAQNSLSKVIELQPGFFEAYEALAMVHLNEGKRELALECIGRFLQQNPEHRRAKELYGKLARETGVLRK